ncbi:hypothetical protein R3W88_031945 [Solanum pinnatisectum]|uniref:Uncharacterized protein n=1 Tax=Solanum pinnatisectum TaxID=50273 RepID=A0AAV9LN26_9SOLN|nr:hypothetical protein R3W88_031945 [Solanum pinnatisectum]
MVAKSYKASLVGPQDLPIDYYGFIAVIFGICSWLVIIFSVQSIAKIRNMENDLKQISMAMMFGITGLMTNYLGVSPRQARQLDELFQAQNSFIRTRGCRPEIFALF